jgi:hypothetical protein
MPARAGRAVEGTACTLSALGPARTLAQHPRYVVDAGALWLQHKGRVLCGALTSGCTAAGVVWRHLLPDQFQAGQGHMHNNGLPGAVPW